MLNFWTITKISRKALILVALCLTLPGCIPIEDPNLGKHFPNLNTEISFNLHSAMLSLYGKDRSWLLKGQSCCLTPTATNKVTATFDIKANLAPDSVVFFNGIALSPTKLSLTRYSGTDSASETNIVTLLVSRESGQTGLIRNTLGTEIFFIVTAFPQRALMFDHHINARSVTYINYPQNPIAELSTNYSWSLHQEPQGHLFCLEAIAIKASNGHKKIERRCHQLNDDSSIGAYMSLDKSTIENGILTQSEFLSSGE